MPPSNTRSGNPARRTTKTAPVADPSTADLSDRYAPSAWLAGGVGTTEELVTPTGQLCLVRRPGVQGLMKAGILQNVDTLSAIVSEKHIKRVEGKVEIDASSFMNDEERMAEVMRVVDKVVCYCVVKPEVQTTPDDVTRRQNGVIYADMIDLMDKMFIFQYIVGGTRDMESFRGQFDELLGGLATGEAVPGAAE